MPPNESPNSHAAWPQLILVIMLAAGAVLLAPIQSERPVPSGLGIRSGALQDIDARLWQDPFSAVAKAAQHAKSTDCVAIVNESNTGQLQARPCPPPGAQGIAGLGRQIAQRLQQTEVKVLVGMVYGGTSVLADEKRRRTRYAVLAGLNTQGYAPVDAEHIGYAAEKNSHGVEASMAYEWLADDSGKKSVLLIWLDDQTLSQEVLGAADGKDACPGDSGRGIHVCPVSRLARILRDLQREALQDGGDPQALSIAVIGPSSSSFLKAAARDPQHDTAVALLRQLKVDWYSPFATLPRSSIQYRGKVLELPNFHRVIASDDKLVEALLGELDKRRFGAGRAVALVGQWDTAYARTLRDMLKERMPASQSVVEASYLRGLDGRLPGKEPSDKEKSDKDRPKAGMTERPEGEAQIDYLRRLAGELKAREKTQGRIGAIGVLGNDYYDKLLVLQALRPAFPDAIFFTTDLDAAMLHEKDNPFTRNLVVASGYGLSLNPAIQQDIPPFRDGYQSAAYLAAQLALTPNAARPWEDIDDWLKPQLFEIGRSTAVPLTPAPESAQCTDLQHCDDPHVGASARYDFPLYAAPIGILIAWGIGIVSGLVRHQQGRYWLAAALLALLACFLTLHDAGGEPLAWLQGVSIWPSEFVRIAAWALALFLLFRARMHLRETRAQVDRRYFNRVGAPSAPPYSLTPWPWLRRLFGEWRACVDTLRRLFARCFDARQAQRDVALEAEVIWDTYHRERRDADTPSFLCMPYWFNGAVFIASMLLLAGVLIRMGLPMPQAPVRSAYAFYCDKVVTIGAVIVFESLLFLAAYESFRAIWLARALLGPTRWPGAAIGAYWPVAAGRLEHCYFDAWLDVRFIAAVTEPVQRIIFYPFPVLVLLILARSSLFDRWTIPAVLWVIFLTSILLIVLAALRLRLCAEQVRKHSIEVLDDQHLQARACGEKELADQLAAMLAQIKEMKAGAFAPLSHQPLVKAVLTVAGSVSGIALLEYASLANF